MARWQPGARERLVVAAVDLFTEQGYDATTVAQIAERAGSRKAINSSAVPRRRRRQAPRSRRGPAGRPISGGPRRRSG